MRADVDGALMRADVDGALMRADRMAH